MENKNENITSIIPIGSNALVRTRNAIEITNKLLALSERRKIIALFITYPDFFLRLVSEYYPLNINLIEKYKDEWVWENLSENKHLDWTEDFIIKYEAKWNWWDLGRNKAVPWSETLIEKYKDREKLWWGLSEIESLPWSESFIEKYEAKVFWSSLGSNKAVPWSEALIEKYKDRENLWLWISKYNESLPWSEALIEKYEARWYWRYLGRNEAVPWSEALIEKYKDRDGLWGGLKKNESLSWSISFIKKYEAKWFSNGYDRPINWAYFGNPSIWKKAFQPYVDDAMIEEVMQRIARHVN